MFLSTCSFLSVSFVSQRSEKIFGAWEFERLRPRLSRKLFSVVGVFFMDDGPSRKQFSPGPKERVDLTKFLTNRPTFPSNPIKKWQRESENAGERERCGLATFSNVRSVSSRARRCWLGLTFKHSLYGPKNRPG